MSLLRSIASGLRSLLRREQVSQELDEELNAFLEMAVEEKMKEGMSRKDALRAVRLEQGDLEVAKEAFVQPAGNLSSKPAGRICASPGVCSANRRASPQLSCFPSP